eukprot:768220-Pleurochrysis_carterae.AAC.1
MKGARDDSLQVNVGRPRESNCEYLGLVGKTLDNQPRSRYRWMVSELAHGGDLTDPPRRETGISPRDQPLTARGLLPGPWERPR